MSFSLLPIDIHRLLFSYLKYEDLCRLLCLQKKLLSSINIINQKLDNIANLNFILRLTNLSIVYSIINISSIRSLMKLANHPSLTQFKLNLNILLSDKISHMSRGDTYHKEYVHFYVDVCIISEFLEEYFENILVKTKNIAISLTFVASTIEVKCKNKIVYILIDKPEDIHETVSDYGFAMANQFIDIIKKYFKKYRYKLFVQKYVLKHIQKIDDMIQSLNHDHYYDMCFDNILSYIINASNSKALKSYRIFINASKMDELVTRIKLSLNFDHFGKLIDNTRFGFVQENSLQILDIPISPDIDLDLPLQFLPNLKTIGVYCDDYDKVLQMIAKYSKLKFILYHWQADHQIYNKIDNPRIILKIIEDQEFFQ